MDSETTREISLNVAKEIHQGRTLFCSTRCSIIILNNSGRKSISYPLIFLSFSFLFLHSHKLLGLHSLSGVALLDSLLDPSVIPYNSFAKLCLMPA